MRRATTTIWASCAMAALCLGVGACVPARYAQWKISAAPIEVNDVMLMAGYENPPNTPESLKLKSDGLELFRRNDLPDVWVQLRSSSDRGLSEVVLSESGVREFSPRATNEVQFLSRAFETKFGAAAVRRIDRLD